MQTAVRTTVTVLAIVGVGLGLITGCTPAPGSATTPPAAEASADPSGAARVDGEPAAYSADRPDWAGIATAPLSPEEYHETFMAGLDDGPTTDLTGIRDLYARAAAAFPYPLPAGWTFPADPGYVDEPEDGPNWSLVMNLMRIWCFWEYANMSEAEAAHEAGDDGAARRYLDVVQSGYESVVYPVNYGSPPSDYIDGMIAPARAGDYGMAHSFMWNPFADQTSG